MGEAVVKSEKNQVPMVVIRRLPRYYRYLGDLLSQGVTRISSAALSKKMNVTASQIRQDFNCFGGFGQQGYGYNVESLYQKIGDILGLTEQHTLIILGAGNMGHALANYGNLKKRGFRFIGIFDNDPQKIGTVINGLTVMDIAVLDTFCAKNRVDIAALALPHDEVKKVAKRLIRNGVRGLWNFSYTEIDAPDDVAIENVHLSDRLMTLSYRIKQLNKGDM